ncbi:Pilus assembly protein, PilO [compost metagenome]
MSLVLLLGYALHISKQLAVLERQRLEEVALKQQFTRQAAKAASFDGYTAQLAGMQASFKTLLAQLPSDAEVPELLDDISRVGLGNNLAFEEIKLLPEEPQAFYAELPIQITLVGDYHGFAAFVSDMARVSRIITLHDFQIKPAAANSPGNLRMTLLARTYRYGEREGGQ